MGKKRALLSLSNKEDLVPFAQKLQDLGYELVASDGTAAFLADKGIVVAHVETITKMPQMMQGRVKTLHPNVHGGILMRRGHSDDEKDAQKNDIVPIDVVCVNLYPFQKKSQEQGMSHEMLLEHIDIGGVALLRAAAKNYRWVFVATQPKDYPQIIRAIEEKNTKNSQENNENLRLSLARKAFEHVVRYDACIAQHFAQKMGQPHSHFFSLEIQEKLRYGENPHETGFVGTINPLSPPAVEKKNDFSLKERIVSLKKESLLWGKEMSYNNYLDSYEAIQIVKDFERAAAVVIKHSNPCGLAENSDQDIALALKSAMEGDIVSSYGSVIALNRKMTLKCVQALKGVFVEIILAPDFEPSALEALKKKSASLRILRIPELADTQKKENTATIEWRILDNKALIKQNFQQEKLIDSWNVVSKKHVENNEKSLYLFAFRAAKHVKSNAITIAIAREKTLQLLAIGAGQPNRVDSLAKLALTKAEENLKRLYPHQEIKDLFSQCVLASDAFFPFADSIEAAANAGIKKFIQPGGSIRDKEVIAAADQQNATMILTKMRHFKH